jgi:hypothetical protein
MAARDSLQPEQLKMFMSANEIEQQYGPMESVDATSRYGRSLNQKLRKIEEGIVGNFTPEQLVNEGVQDPVQLVHGGVWKSNWNFYPDGKEEHLGETLEHKGRTLIGDGGHRFATMRKYAPDTLFPVEHLTPEDMWRAVSGNRPIKPMKKDD